MPFRPIGEIIGKIVDWADFVRQRVLDGVWRSPVVINNPQIHGPIETHHARLWQEYPGTIHDARSMLERLGLLDQHDIEVADGQSPDRLYGVLKVYVEAMNAALSAVIESRPTYFKDAEIVGLPSDMIKPGPEPLTLGYAVYDGPSLGYTKQVFETYDRRLEVWCMGQAIAAVQVTSVAREWNRI